MIIRGISHKDRCLHSVLPFSHITVFSVLDRLTIKLSVDLAHLRVKTSSFSEWRLYLHVIAEREKYPHNSSKHAVVVYR